MFEALIQRNIEAAGGFAGSRQETSYRMKERQEPVTDGVALFNRATTSPELSVDMPKRPAPAQGEPVIAFEQDSTDAPPIKAERSALPPISQIARAAAKMLACESRCFDRMLTL